MGQACYHQVDPGLEVFLCYARWSIDPYSLGVVYRKTLNLYREFHFIGNFEVTQYFVTIVGQQFQ